MDYTRIFKISAGHYPQYFQPEICTWVTDHGGPTGLDITEVFQIIDAYLHVIPPTGYSFIPTTATALGIIDYYLGYIHSGNTKTGCNFYS